jgi:hypothetical protein
MGTDAWMNMAYPTHSRTEDEARGVANCNQTNQI